MIVHDAVSEELQLVADIRFTAIGHLGAAHAAAFSADSCAEEVHCHLQIADRIDVAVDVEVAVASRERIDGLLGLHHNAAWFGNGHLFLADVLSDVALGQGGEVAWAACVQVNECPGAQGVAERLVRAWGLDGKQVVGILAINARHPRFDGIILARGGHAVHFDDKASQHPHVVAANHVLESKTTGISVHTSTTENLIAQQAPREVARVVFGEGFNAIGCRIFLRFHGYCLLIVSEKRYAILYIDVAEGHTILYIGRTFAIRAPASCANRSVHLLRRLPTSCRQHG